MMVAILTILSAGFYTFKKSAHSPLFEEPEKMQRILKEDVLAGANKLADKE